MWARGLVEYSINNKHQFCWHQYSCIVSCTYLCSVDDATRWITYMLGNNSHSISITLKIFSFSSFIFTYPFSWWENLLVVLWSCWSVIGFSICFSFSSGLTYHLALLNIFNNLKIRIEKRKLTVKYLWTGRTRLSYLDQSVDLTAWKKYSKGFSNFLSWPRTHQDQLATKVATKSLSPSVSDPQIKQPFCPETFL